MSCVITSHSHVDCEWKIIAVCTLHLIFISLVTLGMSLHLPEPASLSIEAGSVVIQGCQGISNYVHQPLPASRDGGVWW